MTDGFITLRHKITGLTGDYPAHFADLDVFELADGDEPCVDCVVVPDEDGVVVTPLVDTVDDTESVQEPVDFTFHDESEEVD